VSLIGNHEDFPLPYGISPRVLGIKRADEMMCADHNLTYAEAILMFGKSYGQVIYDEGKKMLNLNIDPQRRFFFHLFFNPLSDFFVETRNQSFLCLDWEEGQNLVDWGGQHVGGHLTRAKNAVSERQRDLIDRALKKPKPKKILLSHFAYLSFKEDIPLSTKGALIQTKKEDLSYGGEGHQGPQYKSVNPSHDFAHGSFDKNRELLYDKVFNRSQPDRFDYILSGHTHRAGAYHVTRCTDGSAVQFEAAPIPKTTINRTEKPLVLIAGSGGPIAKQNLKGEFAGWGHDTPSGIQITFNQTTGADGYHLVRIESDSSSRSVKPRFAVAVDYFNIMHDEEWFEDGFFTEFKLKDFGGFFSQKDSEEPIYILKINEAAFPEGVSPVINSLILYYYNYREKLFFPIEGQRITQYASYNFECTFHKDQFKKFLTIRNSKENKDQIPMYFLSVAFDPIDQEEFKFYNFDSPWLYHVDAEEKDKFGNRKFGSDRSEPLGEVVGIKRFKTHRFNAEVPDFAWYAEHFTSQYNSTV
jgi:hypothetical protein